MANLNEFIYYLDSQIGQPYVWGGQHTKLTPQNYIRVITEKETSPENIEASILYCEKQFAKGETVLFAYDCSGLGMYWLQNLKHIYDHDMSANSMMSRCTVVDTPKCGDWVFRLNDGRATHIGYMVSDTEVIHAKGRAYGVVLERYARSYWHRAGTPDCFETPGKTMIRVKGSVRVREGNGAATKKICTVRNCLLPYLGQATETPYWYMTEVEGRTGFITANKRYTELVEV